MMRYDTGDKQKYIYYKLLNTVLNHDSEQTRAVCQNLPSLLLDDYVYIYIYIWGMILLNIVGIPRFKKVGN